MPPTQLKRTSGPTLLSPVVDELKYVSYSLHMIEVRETRAFSEWLAGLRDARAKAEVAHRVRRLALGYPAT